jgi:hypothetical protein
MPFRKLMHRAVLLLLFLLPMSVDAGANEPTRLHRYTVSTGAELTDIRVRACFAGTPPRRLVAESLDASTVLDHISLEGSRKSFEPNGTELRLGTLPDDACLTYRVELGGFEARHARGGNPTRQVGSDVITDLGVWFWRPETLSPDEDIEVVFDLPADVSVSAPWISVTRSDQKAGYRVGHTPYDWPAAVALGHFHEEMVEIPGARLHIAILDSRPKVDQTWVLDWLKRAAATVAMLYGSFPVAQAQILVIPGAQGNEPVPWAYVLRGGGPAAHFFINQRHPVEAFTADWTAVHELAHLLLPYIQSEDAWLSEGTASYYQNVLRARAGWITPREAWSQLHAGFARGRRVMVGMSLADATERMYRGGAFQRVYWEGAAIMLLADQRLRERSSGNQSLDTALRGLRACCLGTDESWRARQLFDKLDQITGMTVFAELYEQLVGSPQFPDLEETYRRFGLVFDSGTLVALAENAPERVYRDAIMAAPDAARDN